MPKETGRKKPLDPELERLIPTWVSLYEEGMSYSKIAKEHGYDRSTVKRLLVGLVEERPKSPNERFRDEWVSLYSKGKSVPEIAALYQKATSVVYTQLRHAGYTFSEKGERRYELFAKQWATLYLSGEPLSDIATKYDVSNQTVLNYLVEDGIETRDYSESGRVYPIDDSFFHVIDTDEKAYWLGWFFASGGIGVQSTSEFVELIVRAEDLDRLDAFSEAVQTRRPYDSIRDGAVYRLRIKNPNLYEQLKGHGLTPHKAHTLLFPEHLPFERKRPFLLGYVEGKSTVHSDTFTMSGTPPFLSAAQRLLKESAGLDATLSTDSKRLYLNQTSIISSFVEWLYRDMLTFSVSRREQLLNGNRRKGSSR